MRAPGNVRSTLVKTIPYLYFLPFPLHSVNTGSSEVMRKVHLLRLLPHYPLRKYSVPSNVRSALVTTSPYLLPLPFPLRKYRRVPGNEQSALVTTTPIRAILKKKNFALSYEDPQKNFSKTKIKKKKKKLALLSPKRVENNANPSIF